jgi:hypothetical protein
MTTVDVAIMIPNRAYFITAHLLFFVQSKSRSPSGPAARLPEGAEANLQLAEDLWSDRRAACSQPAEEALRRVFARLGSEGTN